MKILKPSIDINTWNKELTCYKCKSLLQIEFSDIHYIGEPGDWHDPGFEKYWINCDACGTETNMTDMELPELIKVAARKQRKKR